MNSKPEPQRQKLRSKSKFVILQCVQTKRESYKNQIEGLLRNVQIDTPIDIIIKFQNNTFHGQFEPYDTLKQIIIKTTQLQLNQQYFRVYFNNKLVKNLDEPLKYLQIQKFNQMIIVFYAQGGSKAFGSVTFNSMKKVETINFSSTAPSWRVIASGLNLLGKCRNFQCEAYKKDVWIRRGFGTFFINKQVQDSYCPKCKKRAEDIRNFGYYDCKIKVQGKVEGEEQKFFYEDHHDEKGNMKTFVEGDSQLQNCDYIIVEVSQL